MALKDTFCSSPWFHMMIDHDGSYRRCRWHMTNTLSKDRSKSTARIQDTSPIEFFQNDMSVFRQDLLSGKQMDECSQCYLQDRNGKISGRQRQLLKSGATLDQFEKSMVSSPMLSYFTESLEDNGHTNLLPLDWQVDLGNHCNSNCVMCGPEFSTSLATEWKELGLIKELPPKSWTADESLIDSFLEGLSDTGQNIYLHLLGGETLITPGFKTILRGMIDKKLHDRITIGFTTNLTVWRDDVVELLRQFNEVHLGMSVECLTPLNDYIRYPSQIDTVRENLDRWTQLADEQGWLKQLRITPTCLSISHLDTIYDYAHERNITVESCNFLEEPTFFRMDVLDGPLRQAAIDRLEKWIAGKETKATGTIVNTRDPGVVGEQILQDARSYVHYLKHQPHSDGARELVSFLKLLEGNRKNSILDYLPEYEEFLRTAGY